MCHYVLDTVYSTLLIVMKGMILVILRTFLIVKWKCNLKITNRLKLVCHSVKKSFDGRTSLNTTLTVWLNPIQQFQQNAQLYTSTVGIKEQYNFYGFLSALFNSNGYVFLLLIFSDLCCASTHPFYFHTLSLSLSHFLTLAFFLFFFFRPPTNDAAVEKKWNIPLK